MKLTKVLCGLTALGLGIVNVEAMNEQPQRETNALEREEGHIWTPEDLEIMRKISRELGQKGQEGEKILEEMKSQMHRYWNSWVSWDHFYSYKNARYTAPEVYGFMVDNAIRSINAIKTIHLQFREDEHALYKQRGERCF